MKARPWPRGLRARLLAAFVLVCVLSVAITAWTGARSASTALVTTTQRELAATFADRIGAITQQLTYPPDQESLDRLRAAAGPDTLVIYHNLRSENGSEVALITDRLRAQVRAQNRLVAQRITARGTPWLLLGTPVALTSPDGTRTASGIEVYSVHDLAGVEQQIDGLTRSAIATAVLALPLAVLLALLAARSVLRPVRNLRRTARRLAAGDLDARSPPEGADEVADLTATINQMAESLQESMAAMRQLQADAHRFAADVAHELRTPLTTLTAVVDVLATDAGAMAPDARESTELAITEVHRLVRLVEDLMEVSRFDAGTAHLRTEEVDIADAVRDCLRARGWTAQVGLVAAREVRLKLDRRRLDVIVANLVGNALRHGEPPVDIRVTAAADQVRIEVTDHGPGLSEHSRQHAFDRFYKSDPARSRTPGSGLGLAIALANARLHGGEIGVRDADGGGAHFTLWLPRHRAGE